MTILRARFDGKVLIPEGPVSLPTDRVLEVQVSDAADEVPGSPRAILRAMQQLPPVSDEDIAELNRAIEEGKQPVNYRGIFDEDREDAAP